MLRIGARLGLRRRDGKDLDARPHGLVADYELQQREDRERDELKRQQFEQIMRAHEREETNHD